MKATIVEIRYKCQSPNCGAEDSARYFSGERQQECINCWKCHGGYGLPKAQMIQSHVGMMPIAKVDS